MKTSLDVVNSQQAVSSSARARSWAVRLALLVACAGSVATSSSHDATAEYEGPTLRLTPEQPTLTRTLVASVSVDEKSPVEADLSLTTQLTVTWKPSNPNRQEKPTLRLKLQAQNSPQSGPGDIIKDTVIDQTPQSITISGGQTFIDIDHTHEQPFTFTFELQSGAPPGTLEVDWKVTATAYTSRSLDSPKSFKVQLTER